MASVAVELGCDWHTVNRAVISYGQALLDADHHRVGPVDAVGLDETLFVRRGRFRRKQWATSIVDVDTGQLIDLVPATTAVKVEGWFNSQPADWCRWIQYGVLDLSGPYRKVFNSTVLEHVTQIADPFHVIRAANQRLDDCRRRVQNQTLGHRGHKDDPLYRIRRSLTMATERLDHTTIAQLKTRLAVGDPHDEVEWAYTTKQAVRHIYHINNHNDTVDIVGGLAGLMTDKVSPPEVNQLGRMLDR